MWKTQKNMQLHILQLRRNVLTLGATPQTGADSHNARTISKLIKTIKTDRDFETNCPTHFLRVRAQRKCVRMCNAQSLLGQFGSRTHRNCCCPQTNLETHCQIITLPHTHTQSLSLTYTTQNSTSTPHHTNTNLVSCQATLYEDMVK